MVASPFPNANADKKTRRKLPGVLTLSVVVASKFNMKEISRGARINPNSDHIFKKK
jgi:hypothetical protein